MYEVKIEVSTENVFYAFCSAFEGGSNYWVDDATLIEGTNHDEKNLVWYGKKIVFENPFLIEIEAVDPDGGEQNEGKYFITNESVSKGLSIMASKHPHHFADFIKEEGDAITADVLLQCIVFGDAIYG